MSTGIDYLICNRSVIPEAIQLASRHFRSKPLGRWGRIEAPTGQRSKTEAEEALCDFFKATADEWPRLAMDVSCVLRAYVNAKRRHSGLVGNLAHVINRLGAIQMVAESDDAAAAILELPDELVATNVREASLLIQQAIVLALIQRRSGRAWSGSKSPSLSTLMVRSMARAEERLLSRLLTTRLAAYLIGIQGASTTDLPEVLAQLGIDPEECVLDAFASAGGTLAKAKDLASMDGLKPSTPEAAREIAAVAKDVLSVLGPRTRGANRRILPSPGLLLAWGSVELIVAWRPPDGRNPSRVKTPKKYEDGVIAQLNSLLHFTATHKEDRTYYDDAKIAASWFSQGTEAVAFTGRRSPVPDKLSMAVGFDCG